MLADLILHCELYIWPIFVLPKTLGINKSSCCDSPRWYFAKEISSFHWIKFKYLRRVRPSEQIFPEMNHWVPLTITPNHNHVVMFIMLYKVVITFESVDEILKCDHSDESYWVVLSCGAVYYAVQGGYHFWVCGWNPKVWPFRWNLLSSTFLWCCLLCCSRWF